MKSSVALRGVHENDLPIFFEHHRDPAANYMAAFTTKDPSDESAFTAHWKRITADESIIIKTILYHKQVVGHVLSFEQFGAREVSYWIVKEHWGKGIATRALENFLEQVNTRPLFARAAKDNTASIRVLEKCGFTITGEDKGYSNARNKEVEEYILVLDENEVKMT